MKPCVILRIATYAFIALVVADVALTRTVGPMPPDSDAFDYYPGHNIVRLLKQ